MSQEQARKLIKETFQNDFSKERFVPFIKEFLNNLDESKKFPPLNSQYIRAAFRERIASYERIGQFTDRDNKIVDVLIINLNRQTTLERGRTGLRNFIADYLTNTDRGAGKSAVLAAYISPDKNDWRFSFVTLETDLKPNESGKFKEEISSITPARRKSFLVGKYEKTHTAQTRFLKWIETNQKPTLKDIEDCFDVESVTKEFFQKYKQLFERTRDEILKVCEKDAKISGEFIAKGMFAFAIDENGNDKLDSDANKIKVPFADDFAKKLLGQIVFLYFLQKKGWFGVKRDADWGTGDKNFLRNLFTDKKTDENFFNDILEYLFYDALSINRKGNGDFYGKLNCKIPFLNGGLFEPICNYDWWNNIFLPDELFSDKQSRDDDGKGILDVFDLYNFTINEAEPLETEVAVDPEMLGKVFENLLPENIRHGSGTYYTPRVIVAYMCQQSLINYLATHLSDVQREDIENFIRFGSQQKDYTEGGTIKDADKFLPESVLKTAKKIDELLQKITVCDPAIGSGAFPVGMMQEIVKAREALQVIKDIPQRSQYELKRQTIENSLYGVDIDSGAVEIAKLRLWLSLIVDEADFQNIEPLPNLDYKIMQGNSLLDEFHGVKLIDDKLFEKSAFDKDERIKTINSEVSRLQIDLGKANVGKHSMIYELTKNRIKELQDEKKNLIDGTNDDSSQFGLFAQEDESKKKLEHLKAKIKEFFGKTDKKAKDDLRKEIERLEWEFIEAKLRADGKTDELANLAEAQKERRKNYFLWQLNFPEIFQNGGFDVVIGNPPYGVSIKDDYRTQVLSVLGKVPDYEIYYYFLEQAYKLLIKDGTQSYIIPNTFLFNVFAANYRLKLLDTWTIHNLVDCTAFKIFDSAVVFNTITFFQKSKSEKKIGYKPTKEAKNFTNLVNQQTMFVQKNVLITQNQNWGLAFKLDKEVLQLIVKIKTKGAKLEDYFPEYSQGLIAYDKYQGQSQEIIKSRAYHYNQKVKNDLKKWLWGEDVTSFNVKWNGKEWIDYCNGIANPRQSKFFKGERLLIREITNPSIFCAYTNEELYHDPAVIVILKGNKFSLKVLLGILNSKLATFFHFNSSPKATKGAFPKILVEDIKNFPIPEATEAEKAEIENLVEQILDAKRENPAADTSRLESEIDKLVYELYELTPEEIAIVEGRAV